MAYLAALQLGIDQRRHLEADAKDASRISVVALSGWAYAQRHGGAWPEMHSTKLFAYAPDTQPESFALGGKAEGPVDDSLKGYVLGNLNQERIRRLEPVLSPDDYFYLGYAVDSEDQGIALIDTLEHEPDRSQDIAAAAGKGTAGSSNFYRLRNDLPAELARDNVVAESTGPSRFPVVIQKPKGGYVWVVFLDFHVERILYPGPFPASERFINALIAARM
ncbi:MAG: hypothetical protein HUU46_17595 [Candidatus Hydrogenedentes bacterium]|nr:hypothetical protein [Candidatus Hydrogenedentota bacterium]